MRPSPTPHRPWTRSPWRLPLALCGLGAFAWACQDGDLGPAGSGGGDGDGDGGGSSATDGDDDDDDGGSASSPSGSGGGGDSDVSRRDVLTSIGTHVIAPATVAFAEQASALHAAVVVLADAVDAGTDAEAPRLAAQDAWQQATVRWQRLEVMQVGPAASSLSSPGGEDLRDAIYSWPTADTCSVDRALVEQDYAAPEFFATNLVWAYGLDALEYLLFAEGTDHTCPAQVQLDAPWAALGEAERGRRRVAYARVVAQGIAAQAEVLADAWSVDGGDFGALLGAPGQGDSPFADEVVALDAVFAAMFYVDAITKDAKLGVPIGIQVGCAAVPCIDLMEAPHAAAAGPAIVANLEGLRQMVLGGPDAAAGDGFDDLLAGVGQPEIAANLLGRIDVAIATATAYEVSLQAALASDPEALAVLYDDIKAVTDELKGPFVMALMLTIPAEGAGDND